MTTEKEVLAAVEKNKEHLYEILKDLIRFPTENPPGNEAPAQQWFADRLRRADVEVDIFEPMPGRPNVVGIIKGMCMIFGIIKL